MAARRSRRVSATPPPQLTMQGSSQALRPRGTPTEATLWRSGSLPWTPRRQLLAAELTQGQSRHGIGGCRQQTAARQQVELLEVGHSQASQMLGSRSRWRWPQSDGLQR